MPDALQDISKHGMMRQIWNHRQSAVRDKRVGRIHILTNYIRAAMRRARYEILPSDGTFYAEIPGFDGVYANADTLEASREELEEVLEEWILLHVSKHLPLPTVDGIESPNFA